MTHSAERPRKSALKSYQTAEIEKYWPVVKAASWFETRGIAALLTMTVQDFILRV